MSTTTLAMTSVETHQLWGERLNNGEVDQLLELYEEDALLLPEPGGSPVRGKAAVREVLAQFVASGARFRIDRTEVLENGDLAIVYSKWTLKGGSGPDGAPLDVSAETTDVVRRGGDGVWRFALDNPWGTPAWS